MILKVALATLVLSTLASADTIVFDSGYKEIATYVAQGALIWDNSWTYNGQPTSPTNYPSPYELELSSTITLYTSTPSKTLYIAVTDLVSTNFGSAFGAAFADLTITSLTLGGAFPFGQAFTYSGDYALTGEGLQGTTSGSCSNSTTAPLTNTPGWTALAGTGDITLQTTGGATDGLSRPWGCIYGDYRIVGGAVFALNFDNASPVNHLDPLSLDVSVTYGPNYESIAGTLQAPEVPEPSLLPLFAAAFLLAVAFGRRRQSSFGGFSVRIKNGPACKAVVRP